VVIVCIDTLRADHTSHHGYERDTTPNLSRLAGAGMVGQRHYANAPWTKSSVGSMFTGLHPSAHGARLGQFEDLAALGSDEAPTVEVLSDELDTVAEHLQRSGYRTVAHISNRHLLPRFGYEQGFDDYNFSITSGREAIEHDAEAVEATIEALADAEQPTFVWCHLMSVHDYVYPESAARFEADGATPLDPEAPLVNMVQKFETLEGAIAAYDNAIAYVDDLLGPLIDYVMTENPNTLLIVTSDHGEEFADHGGFWHVRTLYEELLHVPLVIWGPGVPVDPQTGLTASIDLLPTVLSVAGLSTPEPLTGDLLFLPNGELGPSKSRVFAEKFHAGLYERSALITRHSKIIVSTQRHDGTQVIEVFVGAPPDETFDLSEIDKGQVQRLKNALVAYQRQAAQQFESLVGDPELAELDDEDIEHLKAMGYIDG
jgi:arylsulfatase A-like enzyme